MKKFAEASRRGFRKLATVEFDLKEFLSADVDLSEAHHLLKAADVVDDIYWRQATSQAGPSPLLALAGEDRELKEMVLFYYGPYDRLNNDSPFLPVGPKPPGAGSIRAT